jgi:hypothetical protein
MEASTEYDAASNGSNQSPWEAHEAAETAGRPELPVIGALVGGFVLAKVIKALGGGDE